MHNTSTKFLIGKRFLFDPYDNSLIDQLENDELTRLGSNESRALSLLIEKPGAIITRTQLHDFVWREQGFEVDDSSLTQAISTLRKALKDSTKSPDFIKTVPKRGYQMIAPVSEHLAHIDKPEKPEKTFAEDLVSQIPTTSNKATESETTPVDNTVHHAVTSSESINKRVNLFGWLALALALLLPLIINNSYPPKSAAFNQITEVEGIPVLAPNNHPGLSNWEPMIRSCVAHYLEYHPENKRPIEVIATGGQQNQVWINYIHSIDTPTENVTLRLLSSQEDNDQLCK
ncbi:winged helix-turn-helix domain-containing protein [Photobacterium sanguinicancri]|uniref:winged helix-turn-helix domain-containing protein n=1 Tax=Photobacterium sanguinicancri TaxID=875932 RepID=UPI0026E16E2C|nr:transcriptional regulator [Photobacterium sanguinicancri]MDO6497471.1 transcriptional regulator [Photobacterium sanguinicancri]